MRTDSGSASAAANATSSAELVASVERAQVTTFD